MYLSVCTRVLILRCTAVCSRTFTTMSQKHYFVPLNVSVCALWVKSDSDVFFVSFVWSLVPTCLGGIRCVFTVIYCIFYHVIPCKLC